MKNWTFKQFLRCRVGQLHNWNIEQFYTLSVDHLERWTVTGLPADLLGTLFWQGVDLVISLGGQLRTLLFLWILGEREIRGWQEG